MKKMLNSLLLLFILSILSGCASLLVSRPAGSQMDGGSVSASDARITNQVNSAFVHDPSIPALDVNVSTYNGIVTLTGYVFRNKIRNRAGRVTAAQPGVRSVRNHIKLK
ncbi:MAG TPA: BON domain-containing protein [Gammaproteobacteria bacterium]|nr:BON domain-containing protein [Gammaproteobacteria bacterium]